MVIGRNWSVPQRIASILLATAGITLAGLLLARGLAFIGWIDWPPRPSSPFGVALGFVLLGFVCFEMAIVPRKWLRGWPLGATKIWLWGHIGIGLAGIPVVLLHSGFGFGGPLPAVTLFLFLAVSASGIWGLILQQWLPSQIIAEIPGETIASQVDVAGKYHVKEVERLIRVIDREYPERVIIVRGNPDSQLGVTGSDLEDYELTGSSAHDMIQCHDELIRYLQLGRRSRSPLSSRANAERLFQQLRANMPIATHDAVQRMEQLADLRRQWDRQLRLHFWLHHWLIIHLPLSVGMTVLMLVHAVRALKYW